MKIEMKRLKRNSRVRKSGKTAAKASQRMLHIINDGSPTKKKKKKKMVLCCQHNMAGKKSVQRLAARKTNKIAAGTLECG